tara:strand:- start:748 stop:954 length:207 start_codon:yes stop_codon:yes gene_type:complete
MKMVYVLKIRKSGDEDDVFIFDNISGVADVVFDYFDAEDKRKMGLDGFQNWLFQQDLGYFDVWLEVVR